ncbi:hypothetical protein VL20_3284 [Microcystis panniformis FACHB-1757]|uniref:Uncharacterized protein n=1 Tax=Microcystis panniformis FACHB-1757 TaxID=1638788 RepID=A0A0K1S2B3_9CHRO|nr:hypothetical protein VL20_3284 [Microcystis panniformis FACHB-1757]
MDSGTVKIDKIIISFVKHFSDLWIFLRFIVGYSLSANY